MFKRKIIFSLAIILGIFTLAAPLVTSRPAEALSASDFHAGRIIDDVNFFTANTMSASDIQSFLNAKVPVCDTNGTQPYAGTTRAAYGTAHGYPPPYTCLKDYTQTTSTRAAEAGLCNGYTGASNQTAAQIIYNVSVSCGINPKVLIVLLQKEQGLVTDDWPWSIEYQAATGYGCPDTSACDSTYYGFFNQVYSAARQFRNYALNPSYFNYEANLTSYVLYNPSSSCGGTNVFIENQATADLYNYTPYQPNAAALSGISSTNPGGGDSCSAYGNRNFWWYYNNWFGTPINNAYSWDVVQDSSSGKIYLIVNNVYHWVPGPAYMTAWGLDKYNYRSVDSTYIANLTAGPDLTYVGLDVNGTRYIMSNGTKYRLPSDAYVLLWDVAGMNHIWAAGPVATTPSGGDAGRFAKDQSTNQIYLLNGTQKHLGLTAQSLSYWGQNSTNTTTVSSDVISRITTGSAVDRYVNSGGKDMLIDQSVYYQFKSGSYENAWGPHSYVSIPSYATAVMSQGTLGNFMRASGDSRWYYLEGGNKHYITNLNVATDWGWSASNPLMVISSDLANTLTTSSTLSYYVQDSTGNKYIADGSKHALSSAAMVSGWIPAGATVPTFTDQSLSLLPTGKAATGIVNPAGTPNLYTVDAGYLRHIPTYNVLDAWGFNRNQPAVTLSATLTNLLPTQSSVGFIVKTSDGSLYYLENGYARQVDPAFVNTYGIGTATLIDASTLTRFDTLTPDLKSKVSISGHYYLIDKGSKIEVGPYDDVYQVSSDNPVTLTRDYFPTRSSSYLVGSSDGDSRVWLISDGKRYYVDTFAKLLDLGYGTPITRLGNENLALYPVQPQTASRLIRAANSGAIFTAYGKGLGFKTSNDLNAYNGTDQPLTIVSSSIFSHFTFSGWTSQIIYGDDGKVYDVSGGQRHWITSPAILNSRYGGYTWLHLPQSTVDAFVQGNDISS